MTTPLFSKTISFNHSLTAPCCKPGPGKGPLPSWKDMSTLNASQQGGLSCTTAGFHHCLMNCCTLYRINNKSHMIYHITQ